MEEVHVEVVGLFVAAGQHLAGLVVVLQVAALVEGLVVVVDDRKVPLHLL